MAKGTINLGLVKAIHSGVNPPLNKKLIWFDENTDQMIHKSFDFTNNIWKPFNDNGQSSGTFANLDASNLSNQNVEDWQDVLEIPTEGGIWEFPTI